MTHLVLSWLCSSSLKLLSEYRQYFPFWVHYKIQKNKFFCKGAKLWIFKLSIYDPFRLQMKWTLFFLMQGCRNGPFKKTNEPDLQQSWRCNQATFKVHLALQLFQHPFMIPIVLNFLDEMVKTTISETAVTWKKKNSFYIPANLFFIFPFSCDSMNFYPVKLFTNKRRKGASIWELLPVTNFEHLSSKSNHICCFPFGNCAKIQLSIIRWLGLKVLLLFSFEWKKKLTGSKMKSKQQITWKKSMNSEIMMMPMNLQLFSSLYQSQVQ